MISPEQLISLPVLHRVTVGTEHLDVMGHMNIRWYVAFFDDGDWGFCASFGATLDYFETNQAGSFMLHQFINYLAEVHVGETVVIKARLIGRSANGKRIHYMLFMVNETTGKLAATMECLASHVDLSRRRTSPHPPQLLVKIDTLIEQSKQLGWDVPLSGAMASDQ
jgi:acyl-CoA thioester hydrolase